MSVLTSKDDDRSPKEALPLLNVIVLLCSHLQWGSPQITQVLGWVQKVCQEHIIGTVRYNLSFTVNSAQILWSLRRIHNNV